VYDQLNVPVTCPWCGTNYAAFQPNCRQCGGPLPLPPKQPPQPLAPADALADTPLEAPPPAPRPISDSYAWKLLLSDGWAVGFFVVALVGGIFACTGVPLVVGVVTAFVGIPFALLGVAMFAVGAAILYWRWEMQRDIVRVLREGQAVEGRIAATEVNAAVQVNGRNPWTITYAFSLGGRDYQGKVTTLNYPGPHLQPGRRAMVLYMPNAPEHNALYPHP
jgi:hypothetical protein